MPKNKTKVSARRADKREQLMMRSGLTGIGVRAGDRGWWLWTGPGNWEPSAREWRSVGGGWRADERDKPIPRLRALLIMGNEFFKLADYLMGPLLPKETNR